MTNKTILGGGYEPSKEELARQDRVNRDWERYWVMLDLCFEHYVLKDTKSDLTHFCRMIVNIGNDFEGEELSSIPNEGRHKKVGELVSQAVAHDIGKVPGKTPVSNKEVFKGLLLKLVDQAHQDGHPKNKTAQTEKETAFQFVADLMAKYGFLNRDGRAYSASTISNWCDEASK